MLRKLQIVGQTVVHSQAIRNNNSDVASAFLSDRVALPQDQRKKKGRQWREVEENERRYRKMRKCFYLAQQELRGWLRVCVGNRPAITDTFIDRPLN